LQGVEGRIKLYPRLGQTSADGIGESEKERVARSEDNNVVVGLVTGKYRVERDSDIDPFRPFGKEGGDDVMVTQAPRKDLTLAYQYLYRGWEIRSRAVVQTDDNELGGMMVICHVFKFLMGFLSF